MTVSPAFARYLIAALLARLAVEGTRIAYVLLAVERTGSAASGGLLVSAFLVPNVIAAPVVGRIADRSPNRIRVHAIAFVAFAAANLAASLSLDHVPLAMTLAIAVCGGIAGPLLTGGMTSLVSQIVPADVRNRAYSLDILTYNVAGIVGPGFAAVVAGWRNALEACLLLSLFAAVASVLVFRITLLPSAHHASHRQPRGILEGLDVFWRSRTLSSATFANSMSAGASAALAVAVVVMGNANWNDAWTAAAVSASAFGGVIGSITYARWPFGTIRPEITNLTTFAALTMPLLVLLVNDRPLVAVIALAISGFWTGPMSAAVFLVRESASGAHARTQVFTLAASLKMTVAAGGAAVAGILADRGAAEVLWFVIACDVIGITIGALLLRRSSGRRDGSVGTVNRSQVPDGHAE